MNNHSQPRVYSECAEGVREIRIDDAEQQNRLSEALVDELSAALDDAAQDPHSHVVLLRGRADVFCAGATRAALDKVASGEVDARDLHLARQLISLPLPVVAALEGHAVGGGLVLALCCDVVVANQGSRYGVNFTDLGFTPGMGTTVLLPALVGHGFAAEMMFTAKYYRGRELAQRGLFNHVVPAEQVLPMARDLAARMADKPRQVLEMLKSTLAVARRNALEEATAREHLMHRICFNDPETQRRVAERYLGSEADA